MALSPAGNGVLMRLPLDKALSLGAMRSLLLCALKAVIKQGLVRIGIALFVVSGVFLAMVLYTTRMPGTSFSADLPALSEEENILWQEMHEHIHMLCTLIGERNYLCPDKLSAAADYIERCFLQYGLLVERQPYTVHGATFYNLCAEKKGNHDTQNIIVVGAHYDSFVGSPGADNNGSGIAALLALARRCGAQVHPTTLRFVAFANEEPPFFWTKNMGSFVYAARCRQRGEQIVAMLSLESLGYYRDELGTQHYFFPLGFFYPSPGNFIGFVSNIASRNLLRQCIGIFRTYANFPSPGAVLPWFLPGVFWSDHWPFWKMGYPAIMVTDTALFRNPHYHTAGDRPETLDGARMARVVAGLVKVIDNLAGAD